LNILHVIAGCWKDSGGPSEVVPNLCSQLVKQGHNVTLLTVDGDHSPAVYLAEKEGVQLVSLKKSSLFSSFVRYIPEMSNYLHKNIKSFDIVHNHGHWLYSNWITLKLCKKYNKKLITTPHGTLVPGMLERSSWKKYLAWNFHDKKIIEYSSLIHFLSKNEKELSLPKIGMENENKTILLPNGASDASSLQTTEPSNIDPACKDEDKGQNEKNKILFMGRVSRIKGIIDLLKAWSNIKPTEWELIIVGPWDDDLIDLKKEFLNYNSIKIIGPVYGNKRFSFLNDADAFILPSYGEGLPTALLEAANNAKLILCSYECNFDDLESISGGYFFRCGHIGVEETLKKLFQSSVDERNIISSRAHKLATELYSWSSIGKKWEGAYNSCLDEIIQ